MTLLKPDKMQQFIKDNQEHLDKCNEQFDSILAELVEKEPGILGIPGVYEIMSEHFNNEVLEIMEQRRGETT